MSAGQYTEYQWHPGLSYATPYVFPVLRALLGEHSPPGARVLDVGCGNGGTAGLLAKEGYAVTGIDLSESGIQIARSTHPEVRFELLAADEHVLDNLGEEPYDAVISTEVIEHLYDPVSYARGCHAALRSGGRLICSTPFHGWLKNVLLAVTGRSDLHYEAKKVGGHIKFFSEPTLEELLREAGFTSVQIRGAGRIPRLWMSMVAAADRP